LEYISPHSQFSWPQDRTQTLEYSSDKNLVSAFLKHAEEIFATAYCRTRRLQPIDSGESRGRHSRNRPAIGHSNRCAPATASAAYRVHRTNGSVRLEARSATQSCLLAAERPERGLLPPLHDFPRYLMLQ